MMYWAGVSYRVVVNTEIVFLSDIVSLAMYVYMSEFSVCGNIRI